MHYTHDLSGYHCCISGYPGGVHIYAATEYVCILCMFCLSFIGLELYACVAYEHVEAEG